MPSVTEGKLGFEFPADWQVVAYDRPADSATGAPASFYRRVVEKGGVQYVRGIDLICRLPDSPERLQFIEVKDDRKRELEAEEQASDIKKQPRHTELFRTVMQKTAGTLAGLLLAERLQEEAMRPYACLSQQPAIEVILFLVEPELPLEAPDPAENGLYRLARKERVTGLDQNLTN
ncbi:MAG: hypothetical protein EOO55_03935, partial [Hymenobacter sp.]